MAKSISRRAFLQAAGAAMLAAPLFVPARALGKEAGVPAPSNRLNFAAIGLGGQGNGLFGNILGNKDCQMLAVCDVDANSLKKARERTEQRYADAIKQGSYKGVMATRDFREITSRDDIDAVLVATPDHWHALMCVAAAKGGKDIYCEKPLSLTIREGRAMVDATRRYGRVFQTGSMQRSGSEFRRACEAVRNGRIGKVLTVHVNVGGPSAECFLPAEPTPETLDWDMWLGPAPLRPFNRRLHPFSWRDYRDYSGGGMTDWGAHHFDIAQWGLGMDDSGPVEVIPPNGRDVKSLTFKYASGVTMYHAGTTEDGQKVNGVLFTGTEGKVEVNRGRVASWPDEIVKTPLRPGEIQLYNSRNHMGDFLACIKTRQRPIADVEVGHRSATVCHLGNIAYWLKRPLKWDPVKEEFAGDEEANRWLGRPYRGSWQLT